MAAIMEPPKDPDPTALDAIAAAGLTADDIIAAQAAGHAAPSDPMETRMQGLEMRVADLERQLAAHRADHENNPITYLGPAYDHITGKKP